MTSLKIWRWAPYLIVGFFATVMILGGALSFDQANWAVSSLQSSGAVVVSLAVVLWSYLFGTVVWSASLSFSRLLLAPFSPKIRQRIRALDLPADYEVDNRAYHELRVAYFLDFLRGYRKEIQIPQPQGHEIPVKGYRSFVATLVQCTSTGRDYLGEKVFAEWQACSLMLALLGSLCATLLAIAVRITVDITPFLDIGPPFLPYPVGVSLTVALYGLVGASYLERTRLFGRDVALCFIVSKQERQNED